MKRKLIKRNKILFTKMFKDVKKKHIWISVAHIDRYTKNLGNLRFSTFCNERRNAFAFVHLDTRVTLILGNSAYVNMHMYHACRRSRYNKLIETRQIANIINDIPYCKVDEMCMPVILHEEK